MNADEEILVRLLNVYCILHGQDVTTTKTKEYSVNYKIEIKKDSVKITDKDGNLETIKNLNQQQKEICQKFAAICMYYDDNSIGERPLETGGKVSNAHHQGVSGEDSWRTDLGELKYSETQYAVYKYWDAFIECLGIVGENTFTKSGGPDTSGWNNWVTKALTELENNSVEEGKEYSATMYVLKHSGNEQTLLVPFARASNKKTSVQVEKKWIDGKDENDPRTEITVKLLANNEDTGKTLTLNNSNNWKGVFEDLDTEDENNKTIEYTIEEVKISGYKSKITGNAEEGFVITNTLKTEITVKKVWNDDNNIDEYRKDPLVVTLYANGKSKEKTVSLSESNNWTAKFKGLAKFDKNGKAINYTVQEETVEKYTSEDIKKVEDDNGNITYTLTNTRTPDYDGYIKISGKVWVDKPAGKGNDIDGVYTSNSDDEALKGIKVILRDEDGNQFDEKSTATTNKNGEYTIKVNYAKQKPYKTYASLETVKEKLKTAYVEFEYDGMKYTTVATSTTGENTSKAIEDETTRNKFDEAHTTVDLSAKHPDEWTDRTITAITKDVISFSNYSNKSTKSTEIIKYGTGENTYRRTNPAGAWKKLLDGTLDDVTCQKGDTLATWDVEVIKYENVNLGLFEREQPKVAINSDISTVEVTMNSQSYIYEYGIRTSVTEEKAKQSYDQAYQEAKNDGMTDEEAKIYATQLEMQAQFQNKLTGEETIYTYRRPVNPADIAYIQETSKNAMTVVVTYKITVANLSTTLPVRINKIANYFDKQYTLNTEGWTVDANVSGDFNKVTKKGLKIKLQPGKSSTIELKYTVSIDAIRGLLNGEATLNNAVEIESYTTTYGENTLYAEQRTGGRTGQPYAGRDYSSSPANANIQLKPGEDGIQRLYSTDANGDIIPYNKMEDDTDIAPSFVLCLDNSKTISGIVWEDENIKTNEERVGDGIRQDSENKVKNMKIELYEIDEESGTQTLAKLYNSETRKIDKEAVIYTDENGSYKLEGLVTGKKYFIKYTYGDNTESGQINEPTTVNGNEINARNYKSTVITEDYMKQIMNKTDLTNDEKKWPVNHAERYSVAVDYMVDRLKIEDLTNGTYSNKINMTAYTKEFILPLENTTGTKGIVVDASGKLENVTKEFNKFDFGIIERPREELIVQKTITYFKVSLANGQVLAEGDPRNKDANISYTKAIGFNESTSVAEARNALDKRLMVEIDSELIQSAQLEVTYEVKVINNNEIDSDYGELGNYEDIKEGTNKYISTNNSKAEYYYFGTGTIDELLAKIKYVDYLSNDLVYNLDTNAWDELDSSDKLKNLKENGFISESVLTDLNKGKYRVLVPNGGTAETGGQKIEIKRGESSNAIQMSTSKLLALNDDNTFYNHAEIIEIDAKTARTIKGKDEDGNQIEYVPGNYEPTTMQNTELDDDRVNITITPPTGITNYITTYVITGLVGLITIFIGIVVIKKKVLKD